MSSKKDKGKEKLYIQISILVLLKNFKTKCISFVFCRLGDSLGNHLLEHLVIQVICSKGFDFFLNTDFLAVVKCDDFGNVSYDFSIQVKYEDS